MDNLKEKIADKLGNPIDGIDSWLQILKRSINNKASDNTEIINESLKNLDELVENCKTIIHEMRQ